MSSRKGNASNDVVSSKYSINNMIRYALSLAEASGNNKQQLTNSNLGKYVQSFVMAPDSSMTTDRILKMGGFNPISGNGRQAMLLRKGLSASSRIPRAQIYNRDKKAWIYKNWRDIKEIMKGRGFDMGNWTPLPPPRPPPGRAASRRSR